MSGLRKIAMVTGAGTGIGKSAALALFRGGHSVVLAGRHVEVLEMTDRVLEPGVALLPKPFTVVQLTQKVRQMLGSTTANTTAGATTA